MISIWFARCNDVDQPIEYYFIHSDDLGQYGSNDHIIMLNQFISGYERLDVRC
jgi:hypothetical protein